MAKKESCNCWIGTMECLGGKRNYYFYLSDYIEILQKESRGIWRVSCKNIFIEPIELLKKDYIKLFDYCPICGKKLNWTSLRSELRDQSIRGKGVDWLMLDAI